MMIDYKRNFSAKRDAYKTRRSLAIAIALMLSIWATTRVVDMVAENKMLQLELIQSLAVSDDAADYMVTHGSGIIFSDQDLD
jgi:carbohydrate-binding DOMON domain-containing protein